LFSGHESAQESRASPGFHRDRLALRIHDRAFSAKDLTARHPRTGELLSTVNFMVRQTQQETLA